MRRAAAVLALLAAGGIAIVGAEAREAGGGRDRDRMTRYASPGKIVGAEVAFQQLAQRKGQWTAFRATATPSATMFVPQPVDARDWLKRQKDPSKTVLWQPHQVWMSCDGSLAASYGAWQNTAGGFGYFTTIWQRQKDGGYKWVLDQGDALSAPLEAPEMIAAAVAPCGPARAQGDDAAPRPRPSRSAETTAQPVPLHGQSDDGTLAWAVEVAADCGRVFTVSLSKGPGTSLAPVLVKRAAPPGGSGGTPPATCKAS